MGNEGGKVPAREGANTRGSLMIVTEESVHHLADITQASSPFRMVARTLAIAQALLCFYSFHEGGAAIIE
jgi:hypothetical protein